MIKFFKRHLPSGTIIINLISKMVTKLAKYMIRKVSVLDKMALSLGT